MNIQEAKLRDLTDVVGASRHLSQRFGKNFSIDSVHQLVNRNKLRSFLFEDGALVERNTNIKTRGRDLLFFRPDLEAVAPPKSVGRPTGRLRRSDWIIESALRESSSERSV
ncbi:MAG: hypothetical protein H0U76_01500 [Ktedonobacteraceae bacterium]|nr:hypothetical protein [Ktedonobacteraceae bacterium]